MRKLYVKGIRYPERRTSYLARDIRPLGVAVVGSKYEIASINEVFCNELGYEKAELAGASFLDIAAPSEQDKCKQLFIQAAKDEHAAYNSDVRLVSRNRETVHTKLTVTTARDPAGHILIAVEDFIRPSDRKTSSHAKRLAQVEASARILMHELRNQMHSISLIAHSVEQES